MLTAESINKMYPKEPLIVKQEKKAEEYNRASESNINTALKEIKDNYPISRKALRAKLDMSNSTLGLALVALRERGAIRITTNKVGRATENIINLNKAFR